MKVNWRIPHYMYCVFDCNGALLYVGISSQPEFRLKQHKKKCAWYTEKVRCEIVKFENRHLALDAEQQTIKACAPVYNLQHSPLFTQKGRKFIPIVETAQ